MILSLSNVINIIRKNESMSWRMSRYNVEFVWAFKAVTIIHKMFTKIKVFQIYGI